MKAISETWIPNDTYSEHILNMPHVKFTRAFNGASSEVRNIAKFLTEDTTENNCQQTVSGR